MTYAHNADPPKIGLENDQPKLADHVAVVVRVMSSLAEDSDEYVVL